jgi:flagellar protein FlaG
MNARATTVSHPRLAEVERELADLAPHVRFRVDTERGELVVRVLDPQTDRVVRRIPARVLLEFRRRMECVLGPLANDAG